MATNWKALQSVKKIGGKQVGINVGVHPRYMSMGSYHADISDGQGDHGGRSRRVFKGCTGQGVVK